MKERLDWDVDGRDWPNREASSFVHAAGMRWHVQVSGEGPVLLLLHGTGSSTHTWRRVAPLICKHAKVVAIDLPGHAFTDTPPRDGLTLPGMSSRIGELLAILKIEPAIVAGHSAGAAILIRMALERAIRPRSIVSINGALLPFEGFPGSVFSPLAKALVLNPLVPRLFAWRAQSRDAVRRLLEGTGSSVESTDVDFYSRLFTCVAHVSGTLAMMAGWDLAPLERDMGRLDVPLFLLAGERDRAVPPTDADKIADRIPVASVLRLGGLGHLAHEERPDVVAKILLQCATQSQVGP
jgi:magnesium chelatase accessory protein